MIKSKLNSSVKNKPLPYPKLMNLQSRKELVVLMLKGDNGVGSGVVVNADNIYGVGAVGENWLLMNFEDFDGNVTLSNNND